MLEGDQDQERTTEHARLRARDASLLVLGREVLRLGLAGCADRFEREYEAGRATLWLPVLSGVGILLYFALPAEPAALGFSLLAAASMAAAWDSRDRVAGFRLFVAAAAVISGVAVAKLRTDLVDAPVLTAERTARLTGWVARVETREQGSRLLIRVDRVEGLRPRDAPHFVRLTTRTPPSTYPVGSGLSAVAGLLPPPGPVRPGGYDFAVQSYYARIGAVGFSYGAPEPRDLGPPPWQIGWRVPVERLRLWMGERIRAALPGQAGEVAAALLTGDRGGIPEATVEQLRDSGLAHILAISGLHMVLLAGTAFWTVRALLALSPRLTLTRPIKKWAAAVALAVAAFYLLISGGAVATQRAFIMIAVMFVAVLVDRRAITVRNVATAAAAVLIIAPESLLTASFQMSFAAALALVSAYEALSARQERRRLLPAGAERGLLGRVRRGLSTLVLTSLIAGLATAPFAVYHFQRVAPFALLANVLAMPVVSLVVMPFALLAIVLMPLGLESLPLAAMGQGIAAVGWVAERVAGWSAGTGGVKAMPVVALLAISFGFLWLALWRTPWRMLGLLPVGFGIVMAVLAPVPDIIVGREGAAAVRGVDGRYRILGKASAFEIENWLRTDADTRGPRDPSLRAGVVCGEQTCTVAGTAGETVALVTDAAGCAEAAVIVAAVALPEACSGTALVIDGNDLARFGAHALYREGSGYRVETAYPAIRRKYMPPAPQ